MHKRKMNTDSTAEEVNSGITSFGLNLLSHGAGADENAVVAIYSVASVLGMTLLGAENETAQQIKQVLSADSNKSHEESDNAMDEDDVDGCIVNPTLSAFRPDSIEKVIDDHETCIDLHPDKKKRFSLKNVKKLITGSKNDGFTVKDESFHQHLMAMCVESDPFNSQLGYILKSANKLYFQKSGSISKGYIHACEQLYKSKPETENFASNPEKCRHEINSWVEKHTESKIKELLPNGTISSNTSIIIVNAIYFKGEWANKFNPIMTSRKPFYPHNGKEQSTEFMSKRDHFFNKTDDNWNCQVLEMPYVGEDLSFFVILPNDSSCFTRMQTSLNYRILTQLTSNLQSNEIFVYLPKFRIEIGLDLSSVLVKMGIQDLFSPQKACLTGMDSKNELHVSGIMHKVFIEVNEEGAEAAGATAEIVRAAGGPIVKRNVFQADKPFFFLIKDNRTQAILFFGQYCKP